MGCPLHVHARCCEREKRLNKKKEWLWIALCTHYDVAAKQLYTAPHVVLGSCGDSMTFDSNCPMLGP